LQGEEEIRMLVRLMLVRLVDEENDLGKEVE